MGEYKFVIGEIVKIFNPKNKFFKFNGLTGVVTKCQKYKQRVPPTMTNQYMVKLFGSNRQHLFTECVVHKKETV